MNNSLNPIINALENLFTDLNNRFYAGSLEKPVISVSPDTTKGAYGWCTTWRAWTEVDAAEESDSEGYYEINMCAEHIGRSIYDTVGTLLHEMAHLKNLQDGVKDCSRGGTYHNAAFKRTAEAEREAERIRTLEANRLESLARNGFNQNGETWILLDNRYEDNEVIKGLGGKYETVLGWHVDHEISEFKTLKVTLDQVGTVNDWGRIEITASRSEIDALKKIALYGETVNEYVGEIGDKIEIEARYEGGAHFEVKSFAGYGMETMFIHNFRDSAGRLLVWKTSRGLAIETGKTVKVSGAIKDHAEYKGQKQTVLTRCRIK